MYGKPRLSIKSLCTLGPVVEISSSMVSLLIGHVHANILQAEKVESRMLMTCTWRLSHPLRLIEK